MNQSKKNFKKDFSENADNNLVQEDDNTANSIYNESNADEAVNLDEADADVDTTFAEQADGASDADEEVSGEWSPGAAVFCPGQFPLVAGGQLL